MMRDGFVRDQKQLGERTKRRMKEKKWIDGWEYRQRKRMSGWIDGEGQRGRRKGGLTGEIGRRTKETNKSIDKWMDLKNQ